MVYKSAKNALSDKLLAIPDVAAITVLCKNNEQISMKWVTPEIMHTPPTDGKVF